MPDALMITAKDNVATSLEDIEPGQEVTVRLGKERTPLKVLQKIPYGFKIAVADIGRGADVIKYGEVIGLASSDIKKGQLVHVHNIAGNRGRGDLEKQGK